jgi:hypothetical protein
MLRLTLLLFVSLTSPVWLGLLPLGAITVSIPVWGWLFAVALGMQERSRRVVGWSLVPIAGSSKLPGSAWPS